MNHKDISELGLVLSKIESLYVKIIIVCFYDSLMISRTRKLSKYEYEVRGII